MVFFNYPLQSKTETFLQFTILTLPVRDKFCSLLITFANSLYPDQNRQNIGPDLDPNHLTL